MSELDDLLAAAREAEPEPLTRSESDRIVRRAAVGGAARHRAWVRRRVLAVAGVAGALAAAAVTLLALRPAPPPAPSAERSERPETTEPAGRGVPTDLELPTGDRILTAEDARFSVDQASDSIRRIRLLAGSMLCDVRPLDGGRFVVRTDHTEVTVLGTVFTVHAADDGTTVHVYEGRVEVTTPDGPRQVTAGGVFHVGDGVAAADPLVRQARRAARARSRSDREARELASRDAPPAPAPRAPPRRTATNRAPSDETGPPPPGPTASDVRAWLASGEAERALDATRAPIEAGRTDPWLMLRADALRALARHAEAADAYHAATSLGPPRRQQAGFLEARLRAAHLDDPEGALAALDHAGVADEGSPLRERALALRAELLGRLGRHAERRRTAEAYLRDYPEGSRADAMRAAIQR